MRFALFWNALLSIFCCWATGSSAADLASSPSIVSLPAADSNVKNNSFAVVGFVQASGAGEGGRIANEHVQGKAFSISGSANASLDTNWNVQVDAGLDNVKIEDTTVRRGLGAAHAFYRRPETFAVGAFVQGTRLGSYLLSKLSAFGMDDHVMEAVGGGELALYSERATVYGQAGFAKAKVLGFEADHMLAKAGVRLYGTDNLRFDVEGILNRFRAYGGEARMYSIGTTTNYRPQSYPLTLFAGYRYDTGELTHKSTKLGSLDSHNFMAGVRLSFGSTSLKDEERNGPTWTTSAPNL